MPGARAESMSRVFSCALFGRKKPSRERILLTRQLLQSTTRRGARLAERRMQLESIVRRLYSISRILKDLIFNLKKSLLFLKWCNFKKKSP